MHPATRLGQLWQLWGVSDHMLLIDRHRSLLGAGRLILHAARRRMLLTVSICHGSLRTGPACHRGGDNGVCKLHSSIDSLRPQSGEHEAWAAAMSPASSLSGPSVLSLLLTPCWDNYLSRCHSFPARLWFLLGIVGQLEGDTDQIRLCLSC